MKRSPVVYCWILVEQRAIDGDNAVVVDGRSEFHLNVFTAAPYLVAPPGVSVETDLCGRLLLIAKIDSSRFIH